MFAIILYHQLNVCFWIFVFLFLVWVSVYKQRTHMQAVTPGPLLHWDNGHSLNEWRPYIMCPIWGHPPTFEPKSSTRRHFSSLRRLVWNFQIFVRFRHFRLSVHSGSTEQATKERGADVSGTLLGCRVSTPDLCNDNDNDNGSSSQCYVVSCSYTDWW